MTSPAIVPRSRVVALLVLPPLFWAGNAIVGRFAAGTIAPLALNALRWTLAGLVLAPFCARDTMRHAAVLRRAWPAIVALGLFGMGTYNALQYLALTTSTATNVTLIAASTPVFALALGALVFGDVLDGRRALGAAVSIAGVVVVLVHGDAARLATLSCVPGDLFMLAAAANWSLYTWLLRTRRPNVPSTVLLFAQTVVGCAFAIPSALVERYAFGVESHLGEPRAWPVLAYVAVLPSIVAYLLWDRGVARAGATAAIFFANLTPVFAAVGSALLVGEAPRPYHAAGLFLIVAGIGLARPRAVGP